MSLDLTWKQLTHDTYQKWDPIRCKRVTVRFEREGDTPHGKLIKLHVREEQPKYFINAVLDRNVAMQNSWKGRYGGDLITQQTCIPEAIHKQIMDQCGFKPGQGHDEKKFRQILNDRDNYKLRTVNGRI